MSQYMFRKSFYAIVFIIIEASPYSMEDGERIKNMSDLVKEDGNFLSPTSDLSGQCGGRAGAASRCGAQNIILYTSLQ